MLIRQEDVRQETPLADDSPLLTALAGAGVENPKMVLAYGTAQNDPDKLDVHVFYRSSTPLEVTDLNVPVVLMDTKIKPLGDEVLKTTYPEGYLVWCGVVGGRPVWIP